MGGGTTSRGGGGGRLGRVGAGATRDDGGVGFTGAPHLWPTEVEDIALERKAPEVEDEGRTLDLNRGVKLGGT